jgi:hypothetical protein
VLLLGATAALADPPQFLSGATLHPVSSHGTDFVREGSGEATDLGLFTEVSDYSKHDHGYQGIATLTFENGDSIMLVWETEPVGPPWQATAYDGVYLIIGSTGAFADATGSGTISFHVNADGTTDQVFDGTISF